MSPETTPVPPTSRRTRLRWLVAAPATVAAVGALVTRGYRGQPDTLNAIFSGIVFGQVSLLGIWVGMASNPWYIRLAGAALGSGCVCIPIWFREGGSSYLSILTLVFLTGCTLAVAAVLLIARCLRIRIVRQTVPVSAAGRLQFAIRDLMILTMVVACVTACGKWLLTVEFTPFEAGLLALIYLPFITIGVLSVWPALSARRPLLPCGVFVVIAGGVGMCFNAFGLPMATAYWVTITSAEALSLVASLLVVRSCGYRLVRLAPRATEETGVA